VGWARIAEMPTRLDDLKTAFTLSLTFGLAAAITMPLLLPSLPPEARKLPLSLSAFCVLLALQMTVLYGLFAFVGLRLARMNKLEPSSTFSALWSGTKQPSLMPIGYAGFVGFACGAVLLSAVAMIRMLAPHTLPTMLHPPSPIAALSASVAGSFGEEILCRLLLLNLLLYCMSKTKVANIAALGISALIFGALHAPAFIVLFGGLEHVPAIAWAWLIGLNGLLGLAFGLAFLKWGIGAAIVAHFATDLVWHVAGALTT